MINKPCVGHYLVMGLAWIACGLVLWWLSGVVPDISASDVLLAKAGQYLIGAGIALLLDELALPTEPPNMIAIMIGSLAFTGAFGG